MNRKQISLILCIFLGFFGAHRFYNKKNKSGLLFLFTVGLYGVGWIVDIFLIIKDRFPYEEEYKSNRALSAIYVQGLNLNLGELCYCYVNANRIISKNLVVGYLTNGYGRTRRKSMTKSFSSYTSVRTAIRNNVSQKYNGQVYLTNQRIIFSALQNSFIMNINDIDLLTKYKDGIGIQKGSTNYIINLKRKDLTQFENILNMILSNNRSNSRESYIEHVDIKDLKVSDIQRKYRVGYNKAKEILDKLKQNDYSYDDNGFS